MTIEILHRDDLPLGGFAGLKEHRLVVDERVGGGSDTWNGIGNFVYLADANFNPKGETKMHPHKEIDVISLMVKGRIDHEGSLEHGVSIGPDQVQVQRAGGEGFSHNEINPDDEKNRLIQIWALPYTSGEPAGYKVYDLKMGEVNRIYGGNKIQSETMDSQTIIEIAMLNAKQKISKQGEFLAYITRGSGNMNGNLVKDGDLIRSKNLEFKADDCQTQIIIMSVEL
jgi:hypothetical protein